MKIALGSDHRGYGAKQNVKALLLEMGFKIEDYGTDSKDSCDYPDIAFNVAREVSEQRVDRGVLLCGSGIGMSITANKVAGVRAALCHDELTAQMSRRHNDANVLCLPADLVGDALMQSIVRVWLETEFDGGRHARRVNKILEFEQRQMCGGAPGPILDEAAAPQAPAESRPASKLANEATGA